MFCPGVVTPLRGGGSRGWESSRISRTDPINKTNQTTTDETGRQGDKETRRQGEGETRGIDFLPLVSPSPCLLVSLLLPRELRLLVFFQERQSVSNRDAEAGR